MELWDFALKVTAYCHLTGGSVTSWGRTARHNAAVGGVPDSFHLDFLAVDVVYDERPEIAVASNAAEALSLRLVRESDHDHLQATERG